MMDRLIILVTELKERLVILTRKVESLEQKIDSLGGDTSE